MSPVTIIAAIVLALGAIEATAYWWMHPAPAGLGQPVLTYQPQRANTEKLKEGAAANESARTSPSNPQATSHNQQSAISYSSPSTLNPQLSTSSDTFTPLPEVVDLAMPALRCSTGTAARLDRADGTTVHLAFFQWNLSDSTNVLESFKHLPDECMGSIGMSVSGHQPPRSYQVGAETLWFDHTVFRDSVGVTVHAFKGTWVSGATDLLGKGVRGGVEQWNQLRWKSALKRFHPAFARVAQGAVRGIANPDAAWQTFEEVMLHDLAFAPAN